MLLDDAQGVLQAPSIYVLLKSLKLLAWISRLWADDYKSGESWKAIPNYIFQRYGGLNFILRFNFDMKFPSQTGLPQFHKFIVLYFLELKESFPNQSGQEQILFNNKADYFNPRSQYFSQELVWSRHLFVHDLLRPDGNFFLIQNLSKNMILDATSSSIFK